MAIEVYYLMSEIKEKLNDLYSEAKEFWKEIRTKDMPEKLADDMIKAAYVIDDDCVFEIHGNQLLTYMKRLDDKPIFVIGKYMGIPAEECKIIAVGRWGSNRLKYSIKTKNAEYNKPRLMEIMLSDSYTTPCMSRLPLIVASRGSYIEVLVTDDNIVVKDASRNIVVE